MDARTLYKSQGKDAFMQAELEACQYLRDILNVERSQDKDAGGDKNPLQAQKAAAAFALPATLSACPPASQAKSLASAITLAPSGALFLPCLPAGAAFTPAICWNWKRPSVLVRTTIMVKTKNRAQAQKAAAAVLVSQPVLVCATPRAAR